MPITDYLNDVSAATVVAVGFRGRLKAFLTRFKKES